jgi:hypothetical protein
LTAVPEERILIEIHKKCPVNVKIHSELKTTASGWGDERFRDKK